VFPGLYSLASNKEASIADNFDSVSGSRQWNISFVRSLNDWEVDDLVSLYSLLYSYNLGGGADKIWWVPNRKGKFEVRSFYIILTSTVSFPFPWKSIWCTKAPPRVAFFVWLAALGKILTLDSLRKNNMALVNGCGMCKKEEESIDHLLLHCESAQFLWNAFFSRFGLAWVMPRGVVDLLHCWWSGGRPCNAVVWKMVPLCIMWCLWSERNGRFFEDSERSLEDLLHFFFNTLFTWAAAWLAPIVIIFSDFLSYVAPLRCSLVYFLYTFTLLKKYFLCIRVAPLYAFSIKHYLSKRKGHSSEDPSAKSVSLGSGGPIPPAKAATQGHVVPAVKNSSNNSNVTIGSIEYVSLRKTLENLQVEIGVCLDRMDLGTCLSSEDVSPSALEDVSKAHTKNNM
jgi:hypothetical protein